jgi:hypothetical protein
MFDWVVMGAQSATEQPEGRVPEFAPPFEWVARIVAQAEEAGCRVYLKPNLLGVPNSQSPGMQLIQEEPAIVERERAQRAASSGSAEDGDDGLGIPEFLRRSQP